MKTPYLLKFLLISALLFFQCSGKRSDQQSSEQALATNDLPKMIITKIDGSQVNLRILQHPAILVLFRPECDHCQREAKEIKENITAFKNYQLYFIAADPIEQIEKFAVDYELKDQPNVSFGWTDSGNILANFGSISAPSLFIYSAEHKLVKNFDGETPVSNVIQFL